MKGKVKWFSNKKGYGFVTTDEGKDVFVHYSGIKGEGYKTLADGDAVEFTVNTTEKGEQAVDVEKIPA
jgi:CspA family cold shock protein